MRTALVVPAYNEAATLRDVVTRALAQCTDIHIVDDGSTDDTARCVADLPVKLIRHAQNQGKAASLWDGFAAALMQDVDWIVTLDGDGQHRPEDIPRLLAAAQRYPNSVIIAARLQRRANAPLGRRAANALADFSLSWVSGHPVADSQSGQRAYPAPLLRRVLSDGSLRHDAGASFTLESELLIAAARLGYDTVAVPIDTLYGAGRASHFRSARDVGRIARMIWSHLLAARFNPSGLWRTLTRRPLVVWAESTIARHRTAPSSRPSRAPPLP